MKINIQQDFQLQMLNYTTLTDMVLQ